MYCQNCGHKNSETAFFCAACGQKLFRMNVEANQGNNYNTWAPVSTGMNNNCYTQVAEPKTSYDCNYSQNYPTFSYEKTSPGIWRLIIVAAVVIISFVIGYLMV